ncbi:response regulator transcription factor [Chitinophagaceae bacterium LWZ2-11]
MKLLIVEDEEEMSRSIATYLNNENFICETANDYYSAIEKIGVYEYACILLDITLPNGSGLDILQELKKQNKGDSVLIISAKNSLDDKVLGLQLGADDYLTKPFNLAELSARVAAIIRRKMFAGNNKIVLDKISIDINDKVVKGPAGIIEFTRKEYQMLVYFAGNKNRVITKEAIAEHLWGDDIDLKDNFDFVYTHIKNIRKKLLHAECPDYIKSVNGIGYKLAVNG